MQQKTIETITKRIYRKHIYTALRGGPLSFENLRRTLGVQRQWDDYGTEFNQLCDLLAMMVSERSLVRAGGRYALGGKAIREGDLDDWR